MKKLIVLLALLLACSGGDGKKTKYVPVEVIVSGPAETPTETTAPGESPTPTEPLPTPTTGPVKLAIFTDTGEIKFCDGPSVWTWKTGASVKADSRKYANAQKLYTLNEYGQTLSSADLPDVPDFIQIDGTDVYTLRNIPPAEAVAAGALNKDYVKIYKNATEFGSWYDRQYKADDFDFPFVRSTVGTWTDILGIKAGVKYVTPDFIVYDYNSTTRTATIDGTAVSWTTNFMNSASEWIGEYSQNGYRWNGTTLSESAGAMTDWRAAPYLTGYTEAPVLLAVGSHDGALYWLECNSGWLVKYDPDTNTDTLHVRLYSGDGLRTSGLALKPTIQPAIIDGAMYYVFGGQSYKYDFTSGINAFFMAGVKKVRGVLNDDKKRICIHDFDGYPDKP